MAPAPVNLPRQPVVTDPLDETNLKCEKVARASYDAGIKALKPGMTFADLVAAMEEPLRSAGCWGYTPLVHSLGPHFLMGRTQVNQEQANLNVPHVGANAARQRQAVLEPGIGCSRSGRMPASATTV
jgi:Xaa-Pro aminopeptidase